MERAPIKVQCIGRENGYYLIKFPNLKVPVKVNYNLYSKMKHSSNYVFLKTQQNRFKANSA